MQQHPPDTEQPSLARPPRRSFLNWLWVTIGTLACIDLAWVAISIFKTRRNKASAPEKVRLIDAGMVDTLTPGTVKAVVEGQFYLSCLDDGRLIALSRTCTHLGCSIPWDEDRQLFVCPCHGSSFDRAGRVMSAPANRPLDFFPVKIENGLVRVDCSRPLRRDSYDPKSQTVPM